MWIKWGCASRQELVSTITVLTGYRLTTCMPLQGMLACILDMLGKPRPIPTLVHKLHAASTVMPSQAIQQNGFTAHAVLFPTQFSISWEYIPRTTEASRDNRRRLLWSAPVTDHLHLHCSKQVSEPI